MKAIGGWVTQVVIKAVKQNLMKLSNVFILAYLRAENMYTMPKYIYIEQRTR